MLSLEKHSCTNALRSIPDDPLFILLRKLQQQYIEFLPTGHVRHRHHMVPAEIATFSFHTALLVALRRGTELRFEIPMGSEGDESRGLLSLVSSENSFHRTLEVV